MTRIIVLININHHHLSSFIYTLSLIMTSHLIDMTLRPQEKNKRERKPFGMLYSR